MGFENVFLLALQVQASAGQSLRCCPCWLQAQEREQANKVEARRFMDRLQDIAGMQGEWDAVGMLFMLGSVCAGRCLPAADWPGF